MRGVEFEVFLMKFCIGKLDFHRLLLEDMFLFGDFFVAGLFDSDTVFLFGYFTLKRNFDREFLGFLALYFFFNIVKFLKMNCKFFPTFFGFVEVC